MTCECGAASAVVWFIPTYISGSMVRLDYHIPLGSCFSPDAAKRPKCAPPVATDQSSSIVTAHCAGCAGSDRAKRSDKGRLKKSFTFLMRLYVAHDGGDGGGGVQFNNGRADVMRWAYIGALKMRLQIALLRPMHAMPTVIRRHGCDRPSRCSSAWVEFEYNEGQ
jgi:hypothetical protein